MSLSEHLRSQIMDPSTSDVMLVACSSGELKEIPAHLFILRRSRVFARMFAEAFSEGVSRQAKIEVAAVKLLVQLVNYLYTDEMDFLENAPWSLRDLFDLFALLDQYEVLGPASKMVIDQVGQEMQEHGQCAVLEVLRLAGEHPVVQKLLAEDQLAGVVGDMLQSCGIHAVLEALYARSHAPMRTILTIELILKDQVAQMGRSGPRLAYSLLLLAAEHPCLRQHLDSEPVAADLMKSLRSASFDELFHIMEVGVHANFPTVLMVRLAFLLSSSLKVGQGELLQVLPWALEMASRKGPTSVDWGKFQLACLANVTENPDLVEEELQATLFQPKSLSLKRSQELMVFATEGFGPAFRLRFWCPRNCSNDELPLLCNPYTLEFACPQCYNGVSVPDLRCFRHKKVMREGRLLQRDGVQRRQWCCPEGLEEERCEVLASEAPRRTLVQEVSYQFFKDLQDTLAHEATEGQQDDSESVTASD